MKRREQLSRAVYAGTSDSTIWFCKEDGTLSLNYRNLLNHPASSGGNSIIVQSKLPGFPMPLFEFRTLLPLAVYLIAPLFFLALLFSVINFFLKRFFLFDVFPPNKLGDNEYFNELIYKKYQAWSLKMIILGVTASGKRELIKQFVEFIYDKHHPDKRSEPEKAAFVN